MSTAATRIATYSPDDVRVVISHPATGAVHTIVGYMEDNFIHVERNSPTWGSFTGVDNSTTRVYHSDTSAKITLALAQSSPSNDFLTAVYNFDAAARNSTGLFSIAIVDGSGRASYFSQDSFIEVVPNSQFGNNVLARDWVIFGNAMDSDIGGNGLISSDIVNALGLLGVNVPTEWQA